MTFAEFLNICFKYSEFKGGTKYKYEFVQYFCTLCMHVPESKAEEELDQKDLYYPFSNTKKGYLQKIFRGTEPVPKSEATKILSNLDMTAFVDAVLDLEQVENFDLFKKEFEAKGVIFGESDVGEILSAVFKKIIFDLANGKTDSIMPDAPFVDRKGHSISEVEPSKIYLDKTRHKLIVGKQAIDVSYVPVSEKILPEEQQYIKALLSVYAEKIGVDSLTIEQLRNEHGFFYDDLSNQRRFFFDASSVCHAIRDAFLDGDTEIKILKDEGYDGIREVYNSDFNDGFARLNAVLSKITNASFDKTELKKFTKLIGNSEKKGVCHMLVEDGRILSWIIHF